MKTKDLRIDYSKYEVEEVAETIADAIFFPLYIGKVVLTVVTAFALLIGFLAYQYTGNFLSGFFFFILSYAVSLPSIILVSAIRLVATINEDIDKVLKICVDTTKHVYNDAGLLKEQRQNGLPAAATFKDVFRGVSLYVIRPSLKRVLSRRIKFFAPPFIFLIDQLFKLIIIKRKPTFEIEEETIEVSEIVENGKPLDQKIKKVSGQFTGVTLGIIKVPLYIVLFIYGIINLLIVSLFSWIF